MKTAILLTLAILLGSGCATTGQRTMYVNGSMVNADVTTIETSDGLTEYVEYTNQGLLKSVSYTSETKRLWNHDHDEKSQKRLESLGMASGYSASKVIRTEGDGLATPAAIVIHGLLTGVGSALADGPVARATGGSSSSSATGGAGGSSSSSSVSN
jgi:hypothetical protein